MRSGTFKWRDDICCLPISVDVELVVHSKNRLDMRRFRYSLRGLLLVTTLLAIAFSLLRAAFVYEPLRELSLICGILLLVCTIGGSFGYLLGARRGAIIGVAVLLALFLAVCLFLA